MPRLTESLCCLLSSDVLRRLESCGIRTVIDFVSREAATISKNASIPLEDVQAIRRILLAQFAAFPVTAADLWEEMASTAAFLPTGFVWLSNINKNSDGRTLIFVIDAGCASIDKMLNGGVLTGEVTEVTGPPSSGKTQVCLTLAAHTASRTSSTVIYIDSSGGFSASRTADIIAVLKSNEEGTTDVLERIRVSRVFHLHEMLSLIWGIKDKIASQMDAFHGCAHLLIIDSVTLLVAPLLGGPRGQGHSLMCQLATSLKILAQEHSVAIVCVNNMVSAGRSNELKPALGLAWAPVPSLRLELRPWSGQPIPQNLSLLKEEEKRQLRTATLTKSSRQMVGLACTMRITPSGLD